VPTPADRLLRYSVVHQSEDPALLLFELAASGRRHLATLAFAWEEAHRNIALECEQRWLD
jgi:hypothetical protein